MTKRGRVARAITVALRVLLATLLMLTVGVAGGLSASASEGTSPDGLYSFKYGMADKRPVAPNTDVTYRYEITNKTTNSYIFATWNAVPSYAALSDTACPGATSASPSTSTGWLVNSAGDYYLKPGGTGWLTCTVKLSTTTTSTAKVSNLTYGSTSNATTRSVAANVSATETVTVMTQADYVVASSAAPTTIQPGGRVSWTTTVSNAGVITGETYTFKVTFPPGFTGITSDDGCVVSGQTMTCAALPGIAASNAQTFTYSARPSAIGSADVTASVTSSSEASATNNAATTKITVQNPSTPGASGDGDFTLTVTPSTATVPSGGGDVTYTYTVKNNTSERQYFYSASDDKCHSIAQTGGMTRVYDSWTGRYFSYIPANGTATFTCTTRVSDTTKSTATFTFANSYSYYYGYYGSIIYSGASSATATTTVTRDLPVGYNVTTCDQLWYSSDEMTETARGDGTVGILGTTNGKPDQAFNIGTQTGDPANGSAAVAMNPANPDEVYYIPRVNTLSTTQGRGLYLFRRSTGTSKLLTSDVPDGGHSNTRLGVDPDGAVWTISSSGKVYKFSGTSWSLKGTMTVPSSLGLTTADLTSGDLAFDGLGTMYFITSDINGPQRQSYLFTITNAALNDGTPAAKLAGPMGGALGFNGLAFTRDGTLYGSDTTRTLYKVDVDTGNPTKIGNAGKELVSDLTSCALPKPELHITKTVTPFGPVAAGAELTYTIKVENIGTMAATSVTLRDLPAGAGVTSAKLNGGGELGTTYFNTARPVNAPGSLPGIIPPGGTATVTLKAKTTATRNQVCNQSETTYEGQRAKVLSDEPSLPDAADPTCTPVFTPAIAVDKTADREVLNANGDDTPVTYYYAVTNPGNEALKKVTLSDDQCKSDMAYTGGDANSDGVLTQNETWKYSCTMTLPGTRGGGKGLRNIATVSGTGKETGATVTGTDTFLVTPPELTFRKASDTNGAPVRPGDVITYTLTGRNTTDPAYTLTQVTVRDVLPAGMTYVAGSATKDYPGGGKSAAHAPENLVTAADGISLKTGETLTVTFQARVNDAGGPPPAELKNVAYGKSAQTAETDDYVIDKVQRPEVDLAKDPGVMTGPNADGTFSVTYAVRVSNTGPGSVSYGAITDTPRFASNLQPVSASWTGPSSGSAPLSGPGYGFSIGSGGTLRDGEQHAYDVTIVIRHTDTATVSACGAAGTATYNEVALPSGEETSTNTANNHACVEPINGFAISKAAAGGVPGGIGTPSSATLDRTNDQVDATATYTVTVKNTGLVAVNRPEITDVVTLPTGFQIVGVTVDGTAVTVTPGTSTVGATADGTPITVVNGSVSIPPGSTLAPGASSTITVKVAARATPAKNLDWSTAVSCTGTGEALSGGLANAVTMADDSDGARNNQACVPIELPKTTFTVTKLGQNCDVYAATCRLPGATFALYKGDPRAGGSPVSGGLIVDASDRSLFKSAEVPFYTSYWVVETKAPAGHVLLPSPVRVSVTSAGLTLAEPTDAGAAVRVRGTDNLDVLDATPANLPATGGLGPWPAAWLGTVLVTAGMVVAIARPRSRRPRDL